MLDGVVPGIEANWFQGEIADAAYRFQRKVSADRAVIVGVNAFTGGNEDGRCPPWPSGPRWRRPSASGWPTCAWPGRTQPWPTALARLAADAEQAERNLMPAIFDAVRAYATVGEMIGALAGVFGRWEETAVI